MKLKGVAQEFERLQMAVKSKTDIGPSVMRMLEELREATPVDTGKARDSWVAVKVKEGDYAIQNVVEYIDELNAGSSKQAPKFFIERIAIKYGKPIGAIVRIK